jgi:G3E family GTPase
MDKVPVYIITGLLGAGKTTLLTHLLQTHHGRKFIIIQNELSDEMGIEAPIITQGAVDFYELPNGCICCSAKDGLVTAIEASIEVSRSRTEPVDGILVETTGIADPAGLIDVFWSNDYDEIVLAGVIAVVDVTSVADIIIKRRKWPELRQVFVKQLVLADLVILNKVVAAHDVSEAIAAIKTINHDVTIWPCSFSEVDVTKFMNIKAFKDAPLLLDPHGHPDHVCHDTSCSDHQRIIADVDHIFIKQPCVFWTKDEWTRRVGELLWTPIGDATIFRCKGLVQSAAGWLSLQGVGDLFEFKPVDDAAVKGIQDFENDRLLFVGVNLDDACIRAAFSL